MPFNIGSAWKYMQRLGEKPDSGLTIEQTMAKDLDKIVWYLRDELENVGAGRTLRVPAHGVLAMTRIVAAEPNVPAREFYHALQQYVCDGFDDGLEYAISYALARRAEVDAPASQVSNKIHPAD